MELPIRILRADTEEELEQVVQDFLARTGLGWEVGAFHMTEDGRCKVTLRMEW